MYKLLQNGRSGNPQIVYFHPCGTHQLKVFCLYSRIGFEGSMHEFQYFCRTPVLHSVHFAFDTLRQRQRNNISLNQGCFGYLSWYCDCIFDYLYRRHKNNLGEVLLSTSQSNAWKWVRIR